ncbi:PucR family transcriptional regulator [Arthrobacter sp. efr-133-TYG-120]|uniref:PucR family transcriptional regulator n=1 Tax=Arthrobacter sp. efr-133-TYG-120 TaxID=3040280 RepID=UPI00254C35F3|nr:PucR family transcriptional regulator [Arthrobacter sp. efr-133-TYG-120]
MITLARLVAAAQRDLVPFWPIPLPRVELSGVHVSELEDPTVFLYGGELLLTVGLQLSGLDSATRADACTNYVRRLVDGGVAALGLGLGSGHAMVPDELRAACTEAGLPLLTVPRESPFLAVSRAYWELVRQGGEAELTALLGLQVALTRAAAQDDAEPEIVRELSRALGTWVAYLPEGDGSPSTAATSGELPAGLLADLVRESANLRTARQGATGNIQLASGTAALYPVSSGPAASGYLALGRSGQLAAAERHLFLTASTLLAARAAGQRHAAAERRRAEGMLAALVLEGHDDAARLLAKQMESDPLPETAFLVALPRVEGLAAQLHQYGLVLERQDALFVLQSASGTRPLLPAGVRGAWGGPMPLRRLHEIAAQVAEVAASAPADQLVRVGHGLDLPTDEWVDKLSAHPGNLLETVRAYLAHRGQWEAAGRELGVHRNSIRYRIGQASELLGADLDDPDVAAQLWLALRGRTQSSGMS